MIKRASCIVHFAIRLSCKHTRMHRPSPSFCDSTCVVQYIVRCYDAPCYIDVLATPFARLPNALHLATGGCPTNLYDKSVWDSTAHVATRMWFRPCKENQPDTVENATPTSIPMACGIFETSFWFRFHPSPRIHCFFESAYSKASRQQQCYSMNIVHLSLASHVYTSIYT